MLFFENICIDRQTKGQTDRRTDSQADDRQTDSQADDRQTDSQADDRQTDQLAGRQSDIRSTLGGTSVSLRMGLEKATGSESNCKLTWPHLHCHPFRLSDKYKTDLDNQCQCGSSDHCACAQRYPQPFNSQHSAMIEMPHSHYKIKFHDMVY